MIVESLKKRMDVAGRFNPQIRRPVNLFVRRGLSQGDLTPRYDNASMLCDYKKQSIRKEARMPKLSEGSVKKRMAVAERPSLPDTTACEPLQSKRVVAERPSLPDTTIKEVLSNYKKQRIRSDALSLEIFEENKGKGVATAERFNPQIRCPVDLFERRGLSQRDLTPKYDIYSTVEVVYKSVRKEGC